MAVRPELPALTGLRGIAAGLIVLTHYTSWCAPFDYHTLPQTFERFCGALGETAMTLFFTLSGFVIVYNYLDFPWRRRPLGSAARFIYLRFSRLYPALLLYVCVIVADPGIAKQYGDYFVPTLSMVLTFSQTLVPIKWGGRLDTGFYVDWSLGTEMVLYVLFAAACAARALPRAVARTLWITGAACGSAIVLAGLNQHWLFPGFAAFPFIGEPLSDDEWARWLFYLSPCLRAFDFAAGAAAASVMLRYPERRESIRGKLAPACLVLICGALCARAMQLMAIDLARLQVIEALGFAAIMASTQPETRMNRSLSWPGLTFVGEVSLSLYLFHVVAPRIVYAGGVGQFSVEAIPRYALNIIATSLFALAIAYGIHRLVERPAQSLLRSLWVRGPGRVGAPAVAPGAPA